MTTCTPSNSPLPPPMAAAYGRGSHWRGLGRHGAAHARTRGFTLLELMVTLGVLGILSTIAYPSMRDFMRRNRAVAQSNSIRSDMQFARGQAAATRSYLSVCPLAIAGTTTCSSAGKSYDQGWLVYTASKPNIAYDASVTGSLQRAASAPGGTSIRASSGGVLTFNSRGELLVGGVPKSVSVIICAKQGDDDSIGTNTTAVPGVQLNIATSGRAASSKLATSEGCS